MAADGYVTIHRTTDVAQGELLAEMLRREGIDARFHQARTTMIGVPTSMIEMTVDVPATSEARAKELIGDLEYAGAAEALESGGAAEDDEPLDAGAGGGAARARPVSTRRPLFAAAFAFFFPGGAHLYARRAWTALVLAAGVAGCLAVAIASGKVLVLEIAFAILAAIVVCDAIGGVRAARAEARGERRSRARQIGRGLVLLAVAIVVGGGARLGTAAPRLWRTWQLSKFKVTCTAGQIAIENRGGSPRTVEITKLKLGSVPDTGGSHLYDIGPEEPVFFDLEPGGRRGVTPEMVGWLSQSCGFSGEPAPKANAVSKFLDSSALFAEAARPSCRYWFVFLAGGPRWSDGESLRAVGTCAPVMPSSGDAKAAPAEGELMLPQRDSDGDRDGE
jgi:hypothetical protein